MQPAKTTVGLVGGECADASIEILNALAQSCELNVRRAHLAEGSDLAGLIVLGKSAEHAILSVPRGHHSIRIITSDAANPSATVQFSSDLSSPFPFRGRSLLTGSVLSGAPSEESTQVVATADGKPVWTTASESGRRHDTCWVSNPWIKKGECVFHHLNSTRFLNLLPLIEWLRWISGWYQWQQPPLCACFMFDDPNLHSTRYGFVKFAALAEKGKHENFHTSFATVPLDSYYVSDAAARIIRDNSQTLSLLVHGNNHTYRELARVQPAKHQLAQMRQAVFRIEKFEKKAGLSVSRVMAPPHGVCSAAMMAAMKDAGLEAVCVSHGSVWTGNPAANWTVALGAPRAMVVQGLPVIPRFGLSWKMENDALLAAYLNQPIIPVGHHWDLADGTDILSSAARLINGLGDVTWTNISDIAKSNYRFQVQGSVMRVQTLSRTTAVNVPEGVSQLELETPWLNSATEGIKCETLGRPVQHAPSSDFRFNVTPGTSAHLNVASAVVNGEQPEALPRTSIRVVSRRILAELRDRSLPYLPRRLAKGMVC